MKLKPFVFPVLYISLVLTLIVGLYFTSKVMKNEDVSTLDEVTYVSKTILNDTIPVVNTSVVVINPYNGGEVKVSRHFYNLDDDIDKQKESLVYYNNTYMPSTGVDFTSTNAFEVVSVLEGTIIDIKEDELLGKIVEIRHNENFVTSYAGLSEISVQKGETVNQGMKIGMSGTSKVNESLGNHLHFEVYQTGNNIDPLKVIGQRLEDLNN